jgi:hypothetical protein
MGSPPSNSGHQNLPSNDRTENSDLDEFTPGLTRQVTGACSAVTVRIATVPFSQKIPFSAFRRPCLTNSTG